MKRIICMIMAFLMLVSVVACGTTPGTTDDTTDAVTDAVTDADTDAATDSATTEAATVAATGKIDAAPYTGVFKAGYARTDITPKFPINMNTGTTMTEAVDPLYCTCIAVNDGENTFLFFSLDLKNMAGNICDVVRKKVNAATKIPVDNMMFAPTHNHSTPTPGNPASTSENIKWTNQIVYPQMVEAAKQAIADLSDAEIYVGTGDSTGMAFVRRYILEDGTPFGIWRQPTTKKIVAYESEADSSVQVIRFVRADKKDIVMANWQAHFADAIGYYPHSVTADIAFYLRTYVEHDDEDALFGVYLGASGNINLSAKVAGTGKYNGYQRVGAALAKVITATCKDLQKVEAGKITVEAKTVTVDTRKFDAATVEKARKAQKEINALNLYYGKAEVYAVCSKYGFESAYEVDSIISSTDNYGATADMYIAAVSFGDLGFVSVPYEMFDTNGMEVKNGSPFKTTFVLTNSNGSGAYVPSALAVPNGGYEVYTTKYAFGTAEKIANELVGMLRAQVK